MNDNFYDDAYRKELCAILAWFFESNARYIYQPQLLNHSGRRSLAFQIHKKLVEHLSEPTVDEYSNVDCLHTIKYGDPELTEIIGTGPDKICAVFDAMVNCYHLLKDK